MLQTRSEASENLGSRNPLCSWGLFWAHWLHELLTTKDYVLKAGNKAALRKAGAKIFQDIRAAIYSHFQDSGHTRDVAGFPGLQGNKCTEQLLCMVWCTVKCNGEGDPPFQKPGHSKWPHSRCEENSLQNQPTDSCLTGNIQLADVLIEIFNISLSTAIFISLGVIHKEIKAAILIILYSSCDQSMLQKQNNWLPSANQLWAMFHITSIRLLSKHFINMFMYCGLFILLCYLARTCR